ncbi:putative prominin-1-A [Triplophysa rosa]|uniref:Prominin-1-A n=1 Tax=Triplophysa rosa TaxID=992332 RepID=A0A9W7WNL9_TRIRA|nr:putative prominin-1-A [Triplophysa rosa]
MGFMQGLELGTLIIWSCFLLLLQPCGSMEPSCPADTRRPALQTPNSTYTQLNYNSAFMSPIVNSFLGSVQSNPFPKDLLIDMITHPSVIMQADGVKEVLKYETGFLVCVAIGILYIILMPLIGLIFACCRCCGNCGGRMNQKQTSNIHCKRRSFYWSTFFITSLILSGNVCMFLSCTHTSETLKNSPTEVSNILEDVKSYIATVPKQIRQVVDESSLTVDKVKSTLNGSSLGEFIQSGLKGHLDPAIKSISEIAQVINSTGVALQHVNNTLEQLKPKVDELHVNISAVKQRINVTLLLPGCVNCTSLQPELDKLSLDGDLEFPDQNDLMSAVNKAENADVIGQANKGKDFFDNIPQKVKDETRQSVKMALFELEKLKSQISDLTNGLPLDVLENILQPLTEVQKVVSDVTQYTQLSSKISLAVGLVLSCLILLVVICNFLGLLLGAVGLKPLDDPSERSRTSNCGGIFFMVGVGFSFLVSWIFMIVVLILFIVGGNVHTFVCAPWQSKEIFQILSTPGLIPGFNLSTTLQLNTDLTIGSVYSDCQMNKPLWTTLHLNGIINLEDMLNISKFERQIYQYFENAHINIANITILTSDVKSQLRNFSDSASSTNFSSITQQMNNISETNLNSSADDLDDLASKQTIGNISDELHKEAQELRNIQTAITFTIMPLVVELKSTIKNLSRTASQINDTVENVLRNVAYAQDIMNYNISQIVKKESRKFVDCQFKIFWSFTQWANQTVTEQLGRCGPAAAAIDRSENLVCRHLVASLNAFWFSLGWCMMFLIPSIIFSVKLAKFYRRMECTDVYDPVGMQWVGLQRSSDFTFQML